MLVNEVKDAGIYKATFIVSQLSIGVYSYRLQAGSFTATKNFY
jgi:hypothetical protein